MPSPLVLAPAVLAAAALAVAVPGASPPAPPADRVAAGAAVGSPAPTLRFGWPLRPRPAVLRPFAPGPQPWSPGHRGVDLAAAAGAVVLAAADGTVTFSGSVAGVGVVVVDHGPLRTTYEPVLSGPPTGTRVIAGQRIGVLGGVTAHCGVPCLHWGALRGEVYLDPLRLPGLAGPAVLLPLGGAG